MSTPSFPAEWGPLPSGRHRLSRDEVLASQRGRIVAAMAAVVTEKGFGPVAVGDVVRRANVSKRTFYEHFPDKESCFLAMYDIGINFVVHRTAEAVASLPSDDWAARLRVGLTAYLDVLAEEPEFAWALAIETLAAGTEATARRAAAVELFAASYRQLYALARRDDRSLPTLPDEYFLALTGGIDELIRETLRTRGAAALPEVLEVGMRFLESTFYADAAPRRRRG